MVEPSGEGIRIVEYAPEHEAAAVELMAELQEFERALSPDRTRGADMARDHFAYLRSLCAAEGHGVSIGVERLGLSVLANNTAARQFYLKAGFSEHEVTYVKDVLDGLTDSGMSEDEVG